MMVKNVQWFLEKTKVNTGFFNYSGRPVLYCSDGFKMSVQDSDGHYCVRGESVEIGFPSVGERLLEDYAENPEKLLKTVYPHVPYSVVDKVLEKHGGIDLSMTKLVNSVNNSKD
jgi:hypothetical protein